MEVRRDVLLGLLSLVVFYLGLAFSAVGLQQRLEPTVEVIEDRNVDSIMSSLELLALVSRATIVTDHERMVFLARRIVQRVTEPGEDLLAQRIALGVDHTVRGETAWREALVADLEALIALNRQGMISRADNAFRLAQGGVWVLSFLASIGVLAAWYIVQKMRRRIVLPLQRFAETMSQARKGATFMRIHAGDAPNEIQELARSFNALLDYRAMHYERRRLRTRGPERHVVAALIERMPYPTWILDADGEILAANQEGMDMQQGERGRRVKGYLRRIASERFEGVNATYPQEAFEVVALGEARQLLCMLTRLPALESSG